MTELENLDIDGVVLIVADSLRWDFASVELFGDLFNEESWARATAHSTYTARCMPTILTGDNSHGNRNFLRTLTFSDSLLHGRDAVMFSDVFGGDKAVLEIDGSFDIRGFSDNTEYEFLQFLDGDEDPPELLIYHSMITHWPFGVGDGGDSDVTFEDGIFVDDKSNYVWDRDNYRLGIEALCQRVQQIEKRLGDDYLIVLTGDHGEMLGENGETGHVQDFDEKAEWVFDRSVIDEDTQWNPVDENQWSTEVPLVANRDIDHWTGDSFTLEEIRHLVEVGLRGKGVYKDSYDVRTRIEPFDEVKEDGELSDEVQTRLDELGYR